MGDVDDKSRSATPTLRFELDELARLTAKDTELADLADAADAIGEWDDQAGASGTPQVGDPPLTSRTSTFHDPMTTAVLAEVSRHPNAAEAVPLLAVPNDDDHDD